MALGDGGLVASESCKGPSSPCLPPRTPSQDHREPGLLWEHTLPPPGPWGMVPSLSLRSGRLAGETACGAAPSPALSTTVLQPQGPSQAGWDLSFEM